MSPLGNNRSSHLARAPAALPVTVTVPLSAASAFGAVMPLSTAGHHSGGGRRLSRRSGSVGDGHLGGVFVIIAIGAHYTQSQSVIAVREGGGVQAIGELASGLAKSYENRSVSAAAGQDI